MGSVLRIATPFGEIEAEQPQQIVLNLDHVWNGGGSTPDVAPQAGVGRPVEAGLPLELGNDRERQNAPPAVLSDGAADRVAAMAAAVEARAPHQRAVDQLPMPVHDRSERRGDQGGLPQIL